MEGGLLTLSSGLDILLVYYEAAGMELTACSFLISLVASGELVKLLKDIKTRRCWIGLVTWNRVSRVKWLDVFFLQGEVGY